MKHVKVIIVGGGPAGSTCGYLLQKGDQDCLIIDKSQFPRDKLCGGGLTPKAHMAIGRIFNDLQYDYYCADKMNIYADNKFYCTFNLSPEIRTVSRKVFDNLLLEEYKKAGGKVKQGRVTNIKEENGRIFVKLVSGEVLSCDILVGADGANSVVRKYLQPGYKRGIVCLEKITDKRMEEDIKVIFDRRFRNGYMYVFPNNNGNVIGCGHKRSSIQEFKDIMKEYNIRDEEKIKGAYIPMLEKINYPFRKNVLLIGDAGGYADSMTGEGIYYAVKTGENAAIAISGNGNFREISESVIKEVRIIRWMSIIFYLRPIHKLFLWMCTKPFLSRRISRAVNRYLKWEKTKFIK